MVKNMWQYLRAFSKLLQADDFVAELRRFSNVGRGFRCARSTLSWDCFTDIWKRYHKTISQINLYKVNLISQNMYDNVY